ncbi:hypothetical protein GMORB2_5340 [Geosmithia morbida]|uniref:Uncharacterized protein n=1 Tax=Geosmithia morbida TaxID=1094350 RepID=A0A9P4YZK4_9HYPO|nr:uncharacterized protein GMORB2_5340 [Geosmithia morbida]KAF4124674.1 hypothetical protein GMORB2_5340 [Geosmithia morbida]
MVNLDCMAASVGAEGSGEYYATTLLRSIH